MNLIDAILDRIYPSTDYQKTLARPWLKRNWKKTKQFVIPVDYLVEHLDKREMNKVLKTTALQEEKKEEIRAELNVGILPEEMPPVYLFLHPKKHLFRIGDGISKISVFFERNIPVIKADVIIGGW